MHPLNINESENALSALPGLRVVGRSLLQAVARSPWTAVARSRWTADSGLRGFRTVRIQDQTPSTIDDQVRIADGAGYGSPLSAMARDKRVLTSTQFAVK